MHVKNINTSETSEEIEEGSTRLSSVTAPSSMWFTQADSVGLSTGRIGAYMVDREYVVDSQPVVGSERDVSRLRVVPIANHHDSHMVNANKHATVLMGGGFAFLAHMDTMQLLCLEIDHTNEDPDYRAWCRQLTGPEASTKSAIVGGLSHWVARRPGRHSQQQHAEPPVSTDCAGALTSSSSCGAVGKSTRPK